MSLLPPNSPDATLSLHLFLHARSLLSSAVRLNTIGPYVSHRLLLHRVRPIVEEALAKCESIGLGCLDLDLGLAEERDTKYGQEAGGGTRILVPEGSMKNLKELGGPTNTWPLGEIIAGRHDQLFSKIFNS